MKRVQSTKCCRISKKLRRRCRIVKQTMDSVSANQKTRHKVCVHVWQNISYYTELLIGRCCFVLCEWPIRNLYDFAETVNFSRCRINVYLCWWQKQTERRQEFASTDCGTKMACLSCVLLHKIRSRPKKWINFVTCTCKKEVRWMLKVGEENKCQCHKCHWHIATVDCETMFQANIYWLHLKETFLFQ